MKGVLIDVKNNKVSITEAKGLEDWYEKIDCDLVDIVRRKIEGKYYEIVCDDEALLKSDYIISAVSSEEEPMLIGNLFICGLADEDGELTSLTNDDMAHVLSNVFEVTTNLHPEPYCILCNCDY